MMTNDPLALLALMISDAVTFADESDTSSNWADLSTTARIRLIEISFSQHPETPETTHLERYLPLILNPLLYPETVLEQP
jgi:hypothetical protein